MRTQRAAEGAKAQRWRRGAALAALLGVTTVVYVSAGLTSAYIAADDFQWLGGGQTFTWSRLAYVTGGDRFYRPIADLWFAATAASCGFTLSCHHVLLLIVHLLNVSLVFVLGNWLFGRLRLAFLATALFALNPAYTQAIVWLSAITGVLCAFGYLGALTLLASSWQAQTEHARRGRERAAVLLFTLGVFSHEAAVTLPLVAVIMWRLFGPPDLRSRRIPIAGAAGVWLAFAAATLLANRRNALFAESGYRMGVHMVDHALDYIASLYVGPSTSTAHIVIVASLAGGLLLGRTTRFGVLWLLVTMLPFLPFTTGNTSRYAYLPAIGFSWAVAGAIIAGIDRLVRSPRVPQAAPPLLYALALLFIVIRFAPFAHASVRGHVRSFEEWRGWTQTLSAGVKERDGTLHLPARADVPVERMYVEPMIRWERQDYQTTIAIEN
jgi:hypothetical protein